MWSKLQEVLDYLALPYYRQDSLGDDDETPEAYYTFWNRNSSDLSHYDNEPHRFEWLWVIQSFTDDPNDIYDIMENLITAAEDKGFTADGRGKDIATASPTLFGREITLKYIENKE
jgi:hypothetical protein